MGGRQLSPSQRTRRVDSSVPGLDQERTGCRPATACETLYLPDRPNDVGHAAVQGVGPFRKNRPQLRSIAFAENCRSVNMMLNVQVGVTGGQRLWLAPGILDRDSHAGPARWPRDRAAPTAACGKPVGTPLFTYRHDSAARLDTFASWRLSALSVVWLPRDIAKRVHAIGQIFSESPC